ncbi:hypothetical protein M3603_05710 [Rummeliibacillus stabekisii]|uniref:hypothetical protein n=1 Tax=Rummeliibacillus stabekisii TaxID=241244 RepID=UPI00203CB1EA|nr:hypothetical protein [Rummeliibacillus stabekisii]MCM3316168.1 hypothetical protein [Rummeliibacillus stabekisii]
MNGVQIKWVRAPEEEIKNRGTNSHKERKEQLTQRDIEELMGVRRPRYRKSGGAFKQR